MSKLLKTTSISLATALLFTACSRVETINNIHKDKLPNIEQTRLSSAQVGKIIAEAAASRGWVINKTEPGRYVATIQWRTHAATVNITYTATSYNIELVSSTNLLQDKGKIHRKYNQYITAFQAEIDRRLSQGK